MPAPDSMLYEVEWVAGVWTNVSAYVDESAGCSGSLGRGTRYGSVQPGSFSLSLDNTDGRFSPLRQVLADGVTAHPYWPNVLPNKRVRVSYVVSAVTYVLATGHVRGWPPGVKDNYRPRVAVDVSDVLERFSSMLLQANMQTEIFADLPVYYWPLTDPAQDTDVTGQAAVGGKPLAVRGSGAAVTFGDNGPGVGDGSGVKFTPATASSGKVLQADSLQGPDVTADFSIELWVNVGIAPAWPSQVLGVDSSTATLGLIVGVDPAATVTAAGGYSLTGGASLADAGWHQIVLTYDASATEITLYVDGALVDTDTGSALTGTVRSLMLGDATNVIETAARFSGNTGQLAVYDYELDPTRITAHYDSGMAWYGETVGERIARLLTYAGLTAPDMDLDISDVVLSSYDASGKSLADAISDAADSEGGGAVVYVTPDGVVRFLNKYARNPAAADLTINNGADLAPGLQPVFDRSTVVTEVNGTRATGSTTAGTWTVTDDEAVAAYGTLSESFTSYAAADTDVIGNAQERLASRREPRYEINAVPVDFWTATTAGLYAAFSGMDLASRIRLTGLDAALAPRTYVDLQVEGWSWGIDDSGFLVTFDTSAADTPARALVEDTVYGRAQADGNTLNTTVTNSATTVVIATAGGKSTFTTAAVYPLGITIGTEDITLTSAPGGGTSPQTFTGVTRGANGTTAAAHTAGVDIQLTPTAALTI